MSNGEWYYTQNGQQVGPVTLDLLRGRVAQGLVGANELVWTVGMENWLPAASVAALGGVISAAPAVQPAGTQTPYPYPPGQYPTGPLNYMTPTAGAEAYAGFWLRLVAFIIDTVVTTIGSMAVGAIAGAMLGAAMGASGSSVNEIRSIAGGVGQLLGILITWLYYALMESSAKQATLGKMALGIKVTDLNGQRVSFGQASGRYFAKIISGIILGIGFFMAGFTERKQALHDILASCLVVKSTPV